jgi:hypothetical protein
MSLLDTASLLLTPNAYKESKLYSVIPSDGSGDFTFTRATTATRVNSDGLVELVPYNLVQYSEQFDNGYWTKGNVTIIPNDATAPNGTLTADKLYPTSSGNYRHVKQSVFSPYTGLKTMSIYAKKAELSNLTLLDYDGGGAGINFNLNTGVATDYATTPFVSYSMTDVGDGWYRCTATTLNGNFYWIVTSGGNSVAVTANGTDGIYIWGAQLNEGTNALPYQKTETRLNIPRIDYSLGGCPNILLEPQRTNNLSYSQDFANVYWAKSDITFGADGVSPSGLTDADLIVTGTANSDQITTTITLAATNTITQSVFIKKVAGADWVDFIALRLGFGNSVKVWFNISTGAVGSSLQVGTTSLNSASIEDYGNGWLRLIVTTTDSTNNTNFDTRIRTATANSSDTRVNNSSYYLWGAQLEAGSYATSYIPTTTASVTRNQDVCSKTGISSLIGQTEGTIVLDFTYYADNRIIYYFDLTESAGFRVNNIQIFKGTSNSLIVRLYVNSADIFTFTLGVLSDGSNNKIAIAYSSGDTSCYMNGVQVGTSSDTFTFTNQINDINITETNVFKYLMLFKTRLTNAELATLTTL